MPSSGEAVALARRQEMGFGENGNQVESVEASHPL